MFLIERKELNRVDVNIKHEEVDTGKPSLQRKNTSGASKGEASEKERRLFCSPKEAYKKVMNLQ